MTKKDFYIEYLSIIRDFKQHLEQIMKKAPPSNTSSLHRMYQEIKNCQRCPLYKTRTNLVFGEGNPNATLILVGEAPGKYEDLQGKPFIGAAGKLLRESLKDLGIGEKKIYIANILKCRPPGNRNPNPEEISACLPYLKKQIQIIQPKIICSMGNFSSQILLNTTRGITYLRGQEFILKNKIILMPIYHPAASIYKPAWKKQFLMDLEKVRDKLSKI